MALIFHRRHLNPLVLLDDVFLDRVQSLLTRETTQDEDVATYERDGMCVATLVHGGASEDVIFLSHINSCVLFRRGTSTCDQNFYR
jgi:hypothetical protein